MDQHTPHPPPPGPANGAVVCARCGKQAPEGPPVTWTCSVENGSRQFFCDDCARANIRAIEGRLDSSWW
ncbi:hypothetical protein [Streptomyces sp. NPDC086023]|uniref:hypothetical protein n=1 Tax=Streptomyces sp. NPDC086023 TaxID=3365746 RepID=UPI0037D906E5